MKALTKTTINFIAARGMDVKLVEADEYMLHDSLWLFFDEDDCEPSLFYIANDDGSFTFSSALGVSSELKEELPVTIKNEKHLREVVKFISLNK